MSSNNSKCTKKVPDDKLDILEEVLKVIEMIYSTDTDIYKEIQKTIDIQLHNNVDYLIVRCKKLLNNHYHYNTELYQKLCQII